MTLPGTPTCVSLIWATSMTGRRVPLHREVAGLDALHPLGRHVAPRLGERAAGVDAPAGVLDHRGLEPGLARVDRRPCHAEVGGEPGEVAAADAAILEVAGEPGRRLAVRLVEGR